MHVRDPTPPVRARFKSSAPVSVFVDTQPGIQMFPPDALVDIVRVSEMISLRRPPIVSP